MSASQGMPTNSGLDFLNGNLKDSIFAASQQTKPLFCLVSDESNTSEEWEAVIREEDIRHRLERHAITLRIVAGSQEAQYLQSVRPIRRTPAVVIIKQGQIEEDLQSDTTSVDVLRNTLKTKYSSTAAADDSPLGPVEQKVVKSNYITLPPPAGRMRLPSNAYEALQTQTQRWLDAKIQPENILRLQLRLLKNVPAMKGAVESIESRDPGTSPELPVKAQECLLSLPAVSLQASNTESISQPSSSSSQTTSGDSTSTTMPNDTALGETTSSTNTGATPPAPSASSRSQQAAHVRQQRDREASQRAERDRIKAQIQFDREERRRLDNLRKQAELDTLGEQNSIRANLHSSDIRVQVRAFDGSSYRTTFARTASIATDVRPWVDDQVEPGKRTPYNLKLILSPAPNRNIEASEEEQPLDELGIQASVTMVMVPVRSFVESYAPNAGGVFGAVTGAVGGLVGGIGNLFGYGYAGGTPQEPTRESRQESMAGVGHVDNKARVRTLADQRADEAKTRSNELYNGNQLNFQGRKEEDDDIESKKRD